MFIRSNQKNVLSTQIHGRTQISFYSLTFLSWESGRDERDERRLVPLLARGERLLDASTVTTWHGLHGRHNFSQRHIIVGITKMLLSEKSVEVRPMSRWSEFFFGFGW
jgi:hypothetical protein